MKEDLEFSQEYLENLIHNGKLQDALKLLVEKNLSNLDESKKKYLLAKTHFHMGNSNLAFKIVSGLIRLKEILSQDLIFKANILQCFIAQDKADHKLIEQSTNNADELTTLLKDKSYLAILYNAKAWVLFNRSFYVSSLEYVRKIDELENVQDIITHHSQECKCLSLTALGRTNEALSIVLNLVKNLNNTLDTVRLVSVLQTTAIIYFHMGNMVESEKIFLNAISEAKRIGNIKIQAEVSLKLGILEGKKGNYEEALKKIVHSKTFFEKFTIVGTFLGTYHSSLADIFFEMGNINKSKIHYNNAITELIKFNESKEYGHALIGKGKVEGISGSYSNAMTLFNKATEIFNIADDKISLSKCYSSIALISHLYAEFDISINYYNKYKSLSTDFNIKNEFLPTMVNYILALIDIGDLNQGQVILDLLKIEFVSRKIEIYNGYYSLGKGALELELDNLFNANKSLQQAYDIFNKIGSIQPLIKSLILIAELNFKKYLLKKNGTFFDNSTSAIDKALSLSKLNSLNLFSTEILLLKSDLLTLKVDFESAINMTSECISICNELGLEKILSRANLQLRRLKDRSLILNNIRTDKDDVKEIFVDSSTIDILKKFQIVTGRSPTTKNKINIEDLYISVFKYSEEGTEVIITDKLPIDEEREDSEIYSKQVLLNMSIILISTLGQGEKYHEGLFGPLPFFGNKDFDTLVYSKILKDKNQSDQRMEMKTYCMICFTFPRNLNYDREQINNILNKEFYNNNIDVNDINNDLLSRIKENIAKPQ